ncbi:MAG: hypothetical protein ACNA8H_01805, partial [Anaerolineales bacterium]
MKTKLLIPPERPGMVARPQLLAHLDECLTRKLALLSAPAGYGKTTLLSAWVAHLRQPGAARRDTRAQAGKPLRGSPFPVAWLSMDDDDNDAVNFSGHFCAAFEAIDPAIAQHLWELIQAEYHVESTSRLQRAARNLLELLQAGRFSSLGSDRLLEAVQSDLINCIMDIPENFVLILDDYHMITSVQVHRFLATLIERMPPQMHLVIATRSDPPFPLAQLRARDQMVEVRLDHLRFSLDEAAAFMQGIGGLHLTQAEVAAVAERTEGWAAGLQMASLAMRGRTDLVKYIQDFTGSHRYIMDYLVEEVLDHQPQVIQAFLLQTSILKRMSAPLCNAVIASSQLGRGETQIVGYDSQATLEYLQRANMFLIPLDDQRNWNRYHNLFAELLRKRLRETRAEQMATLHLRASQWYQEQDMVAEALDHAFKSGEPDRVALLIEKWAEDLL